MFRSLFFFADSRGGFWIILDEYNPSSNIFIALPVFWKLPKFFFFVVSGGVVNVKRVVGRIFSERRILVAHSTRGLRVNSLGALWLVDIFSKRRVFVAHSERGLRVNSLGALWLVDIFSERGVFIAHPARGLRVNSPGAGLLNYFI